MSKAGRQGRSGSPGALRSAPGAWQGAWLWPRSLEGSSLDAAICLQVDVLMSPGPQFPSSWGRLLLPTQGWTKGSQDKSRSDGMGPGLEILGVPGPSAWQARQAWLGEARSGLWPGAGWVPSWD